MKQRQHERGTAILVTMIVIVALLGGGAVLVGMQMSSTRATDVTRSSMTALHCAEAGLNAARRPVNEAYTPDGTWGGFLGKQTSPPAYDEPTYVAAGAIDHDLDGDGGNDFKIHLEDNDDELGGLTPDATIDNDLQIYIVSTCLKFPENMKQVRELIRFKVGQQYYNSQAGGIGGNNNVNPNP